MPTSHPDVAFSRNALQFSQWSRLTASPTSHLGFRLVDPKDIDAAVTKAGRKILNKGEFCPGKFYLFFKDLNDYELEIAFELATPVDPRSAK
jgi:hypothetical protein